jgi:hypothetical protein
MKRQISWQEQDLNMHSQDLNQLAASQLELPRKQSGTGQTEIIKDTGNPQLSSQQAKVLCQNEGNVEIKQRPIKMGGRTIYRTVT